MSPYDHSRAPSCIQRAHFTNATFDPTCTRTNSRFFSHTVLGNCTPVGTAPVRARVSRMRSRFLISAWYMRTNL